MEGERGKRSKRKRWLSPSRIAFYSLGFLLLFSGVCLLSSAQKISAAAAHGWSPARKTRFHGHAVARANSTTSISDKFYDEDNKRLVHTGPNPLHN
ncbi:hypothetical protein ABFS83_12G065500 [Erythranthe nasuta]